MCYGHECIPTVPSCYYYYCHGNNYYQVTPPTTPPTASPTKAPASRMDVEVTCAIMVSEGVDGTDVEKIRR